MRPIALLLTLVITVASAEAQEKKAQKRGKAPPYPVLVTEKTRRDRKTLAALLKPGRVVFSDGFESPKSFEKYFEIGGRKDGRVVLETDARLAHSGHGAIRLTAPARDGKASGASASAWLGPKGYDRLYFRRYIRFARDHDQGHLNHAGGGLAGVAGTGRWDGMGKAGIRPTGGDRFTSRLEPWRDWGRYAAPGYMFCYTYRMDMKPGRAEGQHWGNMLGPGKAGRIVPKRGRWVCLEHMIRANTVGKADGELAAWWLWSRLAGWPGGSGTPPPTPEELLAAIRAGEEAEARGDRVGAHVFFRDAVAASTRMPDQAPEIARAIRAIRLKKLRALERDEAVRAEKRARAKLDRCLRPSLREVTRIAEDHAGTPSGRRAAELARRLRDLIEHRAGKPAR